MTHLLLVSRSGQLLYSETPTTARTCKDMVAARALSGERICGSCEGELPVGKSVRAFGVNGRLTCLQHPQGKVVLFKGRRGPHLTAKERHVLTHVSEGRTNPQIATRLAMSIHTVRTHMEHIMDKLGTRTRAAAVAAALRGGLIE